MLRSKLRLLVVASACFAALLLLYFFFKIRPQAVRLEEAREQDQLAQIALQAGDRQGAAKHWMEAIHTWPEDAEAYANIGDFYQSQNHPDLAIAAYQRAAQLNPKRPGIFVRTAKAAHDDGLDDDSVHYLSKALEFDPDNAEALTLISRLDSQRGDFRSARIHAEKAAQLAPDSEEAALQYAETFLPEEPDRAAAVLSKAQERLPQSWRIAYKLGWCLTRLGADPTHTTQALQQLERAESLNGSDGSVHKELCRLLLRTKEVDRAVKEGALALRFSPTDAEAYFNDYQALIRNGKKSKATEMFRRFQALTQDYQRQTELQRRYGALQGDPQIAHQLVDVDLKLGNIHDALVVIKVALSRHPANKTLMEDLKRVNGGRAGASQGLIR